MLFLAGALGKSKKQPGPGPWQRSGFPGRGRQKSADPKKNTLLDQLILKSKIFNIGAGVWRAAGAIADINNLLAGLPFTPTANYNSDFTIATRVEDGSAAPITGSKNITATAVNDAPIAIALDNLTVAENESGAIIGNRSTSINLTRTAPDSITNNDRIITKTISTTTISISVGVVTWLLRGGSLLAGWLTSIPFWKEFDLLPGLPFSSEQRRAKIKEVRKEEDDEGKQHKMAPDLFDATDKHLLKEDRDAD